MFQQIWFRVLCLRAVRQRLQRPQAFGDFIIAEDQRVLRAEFVCLAERLAELLLHGRQLDADADLAQFFRRAYGGRRTYLPRTAAANLPALLAVAFSPLSQHLDPT